MIKKENLIFVEKAMSYPKVIEAVEEVSSRIWYKIPNITSFEHTCYVNIGKEIDKGIVENVESLARYIIKRAAARHVNRSIYEAPKLFSELEIELKRSNEDSDVEFEPEDVLANVENQVLQKEMIALLAQDDRSKKVLEAWSKGNTNASEISRFLAETLGGKTETHRKFIQRFENKLRRDLAVAI